MADSTPKRRSITGKIPQAQPSSDKPAPGARPATQRPAGQSSGGQRPAGGQGKGSSAKKKSGKAKRGGLHRYGTGTGGCLGRGALVLFTLLLVGVIIGVLLAIFLIGR